MLFTSPTYVLFLTTVFLIFWFLNGRNLVARNLFLLAASYCFYGLWDWRFLGLLTGVSLVNYFIGRAIGHHEARLRRKAWLVAGLVVNLGNLIFFKYFNFFIAEFIEVSRLIGFNVNWFELKLIIPIGISFYTFLSVSYLVDIYRKKIVPEKFLPDVLLTLSFFPIILAGPIQRPASLLPQIQTKHLYSGQLFADGLRQILWGLFAKLVIADNCAPYVDRIFSGCHTFSGSTLLLGIVLFAIQIYADFSGYSDIAIGSAKLLGFNLMRNFAYPYFAKDIVDFWKRWHISLTSWFRDYLFLPLAFYISGKIRRQRILFVGSDLIIYAVAISFTWFLTGFWHGAMFTFIAWGLIHAASLILHRALRKNRMKMIRRFNLRGDRMLKGFIRLITLTVIMVSGIFFRSDSVAHALEYIHNTCSLDLFVTPKILPLEMILPVLFYFGIEWMQRTKQYGLEMSTSGKPVIFRWGLYYLVIFLIFFYANTHQEFIYFQF